jgi:hypothetical protein
MGILAGPGLSAKIDQVPGWYPNMHKYENRFTMSILVRL